MLRQLTGSVPHGCIAGSFGSIAQLAERPAVNRKVAGSIPAVPVYGASSNGRAPVLYAEDAGSIPAAPIMLLLLGGSAAVS